MQKNTDQSNSECRHLLRIDYRYRKKRSTELATVYLIDEIRKAAVKGLITGILFVELSKAFGTLGHS